jgi:hypothetical protein
MQPPNRYNMWLYCLAASVVCGSLYLLVHRQLPTADWRATLADNLFFPTFILAGLFGVLTLATRPSRDSSQRAKATAAAREFLTRLRDSPFRLFLALPSAPYHIALPELISSSQENLRPVHTYKDLYRLYELAPSTHLPASDDFQPDCKYDWSEYDVVILSARASDVAVIVDALRREEPHLRVYTSQTAESEPIDRVAQRWYFAAGRFCIALIDKSIVTDTRQKSCLNWALQRNKLDVARGMRYLRVVALDLEGYQYLNREGIHVDQEPALDDAGAIWVTRVCESTIRDLRNTPGFVSDEVRKKLRRRWTAQFPSEIRAELEKCAKALPQHVMTLLWSMDRHIRDIEQTPESIYHDLSQRTKAALFEANIALPASVQRLFDANSWCDTSDKDAPAATSDRDSHTAEERLLKVRIVMAIAMQVVTSSDSVADCLLRLCGKAHVVLLIHGIRDWQMKWENDVKRILEQSNDIDRVQPISYGYFDVFRFLAFVPTAGPPLEAIKTGIRHVLCQYPAARVSVVAHSFGTYLIMQILKDETFHLHVFRMVLCGSVLRQTFDWGAVAGRIGGGTKLREVVINECGSRDCWPMLAKAAGWGYGDSGTRGFCSAFVTDRYHKGPHSLFLHEEFAQRYWKPFFESGAIEKANPAADPAEDIPEWIKWIGWLPLRYVIVALYVSVAIAVGWIAYLAFTWASWRVGLST